MPIQILPAQLANQIAAGEVVERPASVVKELVENCLDAGATRIDIDIEKGGARRIRIRDNGCGIAKDELGLALSRHATSKIASLDDLESIMSLGFRGEALASISSVSRLTLTSRVNGQDEAWSAYAEGRDMSVQLKPAAHPVGTTLDVLDLFFNTPARRKFLRTEKTEFTHIDEVIKRIALSRFDVDLCLRHNGKVVRQYRKAETQLQKERRLAAICGNGFVTKSVSVELQHHDLSFSGWICTPQGARGQGDLQYCYVNGRMMKDKLINHAIRQAYEHSLSSDQYAAYVLFITIDPQQVDVNVHPAKHEVRFHQGRLVHDFIYQAVQSALQQSQETEVVYAVAQRGYAQTTDQDFHVCEPTPDTLAIADAPIYPNQAPKEAWLSDSMNRRERTVSDDDSLEQGNRVAASVINKLENSARPLNDKTVTNNKSPSSASLTRTPPNKEETHLYQTLLMPSDADVIDESHALRVKQVSDYPKALASSDSTPLTDKVNITRLGKPLVVLEDCYLLMAQQEGLSLLSLAKAEWLCQWKRLQPAEEAGLKAQPLLIPHKIPLSEEAMACADYHQEVLGQLGIEVKAHHKDKLTILSISTPLRQQNFQQFFPHLLDYLARVSEDSEQQGWMPLLNWLATESVTTTDVFSLSSAIQLLSDLEQLWGNELEHHYSTLLRPLDVSSVINAF